MVSDPHGKPQLLGLSGVNPGTSYVLKGKK